MFAAQRSEATVAPPPRNVSKTSAYQPAQQSGLIEVGLVHDCGRVSKAPRAVKRLPQPTASCHVPCARRRVTLLRSRQTWPKERQFRVGVGFISWLAQSSGATSFADLRPSIALTQPLTLVTPSVNMVQ